MDKKQEKRVEDKFIDNIPPWFWKWGGIAFITTSFLLANQIPLGTTITNLSNIYVEKQRAGITYGHKLTQALENHNVLITKLQNKQVETERRLGDALHEIAELKANSHPPTKR